MMSSDVHNHIHPPPPSEVKHLDCVSQVLLHSIRISALATANEYITVWLEIFIDQNFSESGSHT